MKKILLALSGIVLSTVAFSQITFRVESPVGIQGPYDFIEAGTGWGLPSLAGVYVTDTIVLANDGTPGLNAQGNPASATGCNALPAGSLAGKIAMVFRGDGGTPAIGGCEFGLKAKNCQDAGAVAVIIVNRDAMPVGMQAGAGTPPAGSTVTIPVINIGLLTGQAILNTIQGGTAVVGSIGDKTGLFADDVTIFQDSTVRAKYAAAPTIGNLDGSSFPVNVGSWVYNWGSNDQTGVTLNATIMNGATSLYNQTSTPFDLLSGDSVFVTLPNYEPTAHTPGRNVLTYKVILTTTDSDTSDNEVSSDFVVNGNILSYARVDNNNLPVVDGGIQPADLGASEEFVSCIHFSDPNASDIGVDGLYFATSAVSGVDINGSEVILTAYKWNDAFVDLNDANFAMTSFEEIATGSYIYTDSIPNQIVYGRFNDQFILEDNQRYLFCITTFGSSFYIGYDTDTKYDWTLNASPSPQPFTLINVAQTDWFTGFTSGVVPSIGVYMFPAEELTINENVVEASAFPNPSKDVITVKVNANGDATLKVTDLAGRSVSNGTVKINNGQFTTNVADMNAGTYVFTLEYANGTTSRFNVVVSK